MQIPKSSSWPPLPGLNPAAPTWQPIKSSLNRKEFSRLVDQVNEALRHLPPPTISTTRSESEVLNLLEGAPRLRTLHDWKTEIENPSSPRYEQARMRRYMENAKGTWHNGTTVYGVTLLRDPQSPLGVHDAFGGVSLTLGKDAFNRATFLSTDSMFTKQRPAGKKRLPEIIAERLIRDAGLTKEVNMNDETLPKAQQKKLKKIIEDAVENKSTPQQPLIDALHLPDFGAGFRFVEAQVPSVTIKDVVRIDIGKQVASADRDMIMTLAAAHGIPVGVNN